MADQETRSKNFAFNYQSDIFNQKTPVKPEFNYSHKGFQNNPPNKSSSNFFFFCRFYICSFNKSI